MGKIVECPDPEPAKGPHAELVEARRTSMQLSKP
jgi:hypothetical protein